MQRFTERDEYGNADIIALSDTMPEIYAELSFSEANIMTEAINRLAAYEDTGLTPEEVQQITWKPGTEPPEDERSVIAQYHFVGNPGMVFTSVLSYFAHDPKPHWQHGGGGVLIVDRWMPIPPTQEGDDQ